MSTNSSLTQRIKTPLSAIGVSLATLLMITALALTLTPVLPQIISDTSTPRHKQPAGASESAATPTEQTVEIASTSPVELIVLAAPVTLAEQQASTQNAPISTSTPQQPQNPPSQPTPTLGAPLARIEISNHGVGIGVNDTEVKVDRTALQPVTDVVHEVITTATNKLPVKL